MCSSLHPKSWLKAKIYICVLLGLGILFITVPEQNKVSISTSSLISIRSSYCVSVTLPVTLRISEDSAKAKLNESKNTGAISTKTRIVSLWAHQNILLDIC